MGAWSALTFAISGWLIAAATIILLWNGGGGWIAKVRNYTVPIALVVATCVCTLFANVYQQLMKIFSARSESVIGDLYRVKPADSNRVWVSACGSVLFISLAAGAAYTYYAYSIYNQTDLATNEQQETGGAIVPVTGTKLKVNRDPLVRCTEIDDISVRKKKRLESSQLSDVSTIQQRQQCVFSHYVALAKDSEAAGRPLLAANYLNLAHTILFGLAVVE